MEVKEDLIKFVKFRLGSDVFTAEDFDCALELSLRAFNMVPEVTYFKWDDVETIDMISDILVTYASHLLLVKQSLSERGREFQINDNGVAWMPPSVSELTFSISHELWTAWDEQVRDLKQSSSFYNDFIVDE